ncbi:MAG: pyridoxamine 5'-phosphate oxidase family protein [Candidatus Shapirobacteria bacterium]|nr:pyridoxamine 5'-phosphate oxidase family protein [Candidatus Shapirobacteria bacterium]
MIDKNIVLQILKNNDLCVLSTASLSGKTESAIMALTVKDDFTLLMNTEPTSRKIVNLKVNQTVSVIIGGLKNDPSIQLDGVATLLEGDSAKSACSTMLSIHPELKDYGIESGTFISIKPFWCRYSDFSKNPPEIAEVEL